MEGRCSATGASNEDLPLDLWVHELKTRDLCLRVNDILNMKEGDSIKVLLLWNRTFSIARRQFGDRYPPLPPTLFFRANCWFTFTKSKGLQGHARFSYDYRFRPFQFEIELADGEWDNHPDYEPLERVQGCRVGFGGVSTRWDWLHDMPAVGIQ